MNATPAPATFAGAAGVLRRSPRRSDDLVFRTRPVAPRFPFAAGRAADDRTHQEDPMALNRTFDLIMVSAAFLFVSAMCVGLL